MRLPEPGMMWNCAGKNWQYTKSLSVVRQSIAHNELVAELVIANHWKAPHVSLPFSLSSASTWLYLSDSFYLTLSAFLMTFLTSSICLDHNLYSYWYRYAPIKYKFMYTNMPHQSRSYFDFCAGNSAEEWSRDTGIVLALSALCHIWITWESNNGGCSIS